MSRNKKTKKSMSEGAKWVITFIVFIMAISTVIVCAKKGAFHFEAGTVTANDDTVATDTQKQDAEQQGEDGEAEEGSSSKYTVFVTAGNGGTANPNGSVSVDAWDSITLQFMPDKGYVVQSVTLDGMDLGAVKSYTIEYIDQDHNVVVTFTDEPEPTDESDDGDGGSIDEKLSHGVVSIIENIIDHVENGD